MDDYSPVTPPAAAFKVGRLRSNPSIGGAVPLERGGTPAQPG